MKGYESIYIKPPPLPSLTFECEGPRLIITHIENENFKSYQGKRTLGPFHKSFTSIVGPNGSGKSNVIDSMLFVFGYRANKIRLKKISGLIHNSENFPDMRYCKVKVFFQVNELIIYAILIIFIYYFKMENQLMLHFVSWVFTQSSGRY